MLSYRLGTVKTLGSLGSLTMHATDCMPKKVVFVFKRYAVRKTKIRSYAIRKYKMKQWARKEGDSPSLIFVKYKLDYFSN